MTDFKLALDANVVLAETPIWDTRAQKLFWTDLFAGDVHLFDPATKEDKLWRTGLPIGSAIPCSDENLVMAALADGMFLLDLTSGKLDLIADPEPGNDANRYNDTRVDARGRIFASSTSKLFGTADYKPDMLGRFYMMDTDKTVHVVVPEINHYNAIVWNHGNTMMYVVDTFNQTLLAFDYDINSGPKGAPRVAIDFKEVGLPDGMSIDAEDNLYVCHWPDTEKGLITVWDKGLSLKEKIEFPMNQVCCGGFGGAGLKDFYVATAQFGFTPGDKEKYPGAGGIFVAKSDIAGTADHYYIVR